MKALVCGSRSWEDHEQIYDALFALTTWAVIEDENITVIHGGAWGADTAADIAARTLGYDIECFTPDWKRYGRSAGIVRNLDMLDQNPDVVLAFWDGVSRGTAHTINEAKKRGIKLVIFHPKGGGEEHEQPEGYVR